LNQENEQVTISYGIATYKLDRGYQRIDKNIYESVRKLSPLHTEYPETTIYDHSTSSYLKLFEVPEDPQDPLESGEPKIIIPLLKNNKTSLEFNYLSLLYDTKLTGSFVLDDSAIAAGTSNLKPVLASFTFTTEDGEEYFDYVTIDPTEGTEFDFDISLQPIHAMAGYTTFDITIDFISHGDNEKVMPYVIFESFNLTAEDRILETISRPMRTEEGNLDVSEIISLPNFIQIFSGSLYDTFGIEDERWATVSIEGFNGYADLVRLYRDASEELAFETMLTEEGLDEYYFEVLESSGYQLTESLGLHLDAYDLEVPEYLQGEINLYAGKGAYPYGDVYEEKEFEMNWDDLGYSDYTVDLGTFSASTYNSQFELSYLPLTSDGVYADAEIYLHHRVDISVAENIITENLPVGVNFAVLIPSSTTRIDAVDVSQVDRVSVPWTWVESWQGFSLTESDFDSYVHDNALLSSYSPSSTTLTEGYHYDLVETSEGSYLHFYFEYLDIISTLGSDEIQIDFHSSHSFDESDFSISEDANTYNSIFNWKFPDSSYELRNWDDFEYHPDLTSATNFSASFFHLSEFAPIEDWKSSTTDEFQFYPNVYNFTEIEFTGFVEGTFNVEVNLTNGGYFDYIINDPEQDEWENIRPFGLNIETTEGGLSLRLGTRWLR